MILFIFQFIFIEKQFRELISTKQISWVSLNFGMVKILIVALSLSINFVSNVSKFPAKYRSGSSLMTNGSVSRLG